MNFHLVAQKSIKKNDCRPKLISDEAQRKPRSRSYCLAEALGARE